MFSTDYAVLLDTGEKKGEGARGIGAREMEKGARVKGQGRRDGG